jgi:hypothetical protein
MVWVNGVYLEVWYLDLVSKIYLVSKSDGFSKHDMVYNLIGIGFARFTHEVFLYFKEIL